MDRILPQDATMDEQEEEDTRIGQDAIYAPIYDEDKFSKIPASMFARHPEWIEHLMQESPYNYMHLPLETKLANPKLPERTLRGAAAMYAHDIPPEIKRNNWRLAATAVAANRSNYQHVPLEMRQSLSDESIELARLATRTDNHARFNQPMSRPAYREDMLVKPFFHVSTPHDWSNMQEHMPPATRRALLRHLYTSGDHEQLRDMGRFAETREAVERMPNLSGLSLAAAGGTIRTMLPPEIRGSILNFAKQVNSQETDHIAWASSEIRMMWRVINAILWMCREGHYSSYSYKLMDLIKHLKIIIERFCDPHHAWAMEAGDGPSLVHRPLTAAQRDHIAMCADNAWSAFQIVREIGDHFFEVFHRRLSSSHDDELRELAEKLVSLGFPEPQTPNNLAQLAAAYLHKPIVPEDDETMFCEDYRDMLPPL